MCLQAIHCHDSDLSACAFGELYMVPRSDDTLQRAKPAVRPSLLPLEGLKLGEWDIFPQLSHAVPQRAEDRGVGYADQIICFFRKIVCQVGGSGFHVSAVSVSCPASAWSSLVVLLVLPAGLFHRGAHISRYVSNIHEFADKI